MKPRAASGPRPRREQWGSLVDVALWLGTLAGVIIVLFREEILPARFFYDGDVIRGVARGTWGVGEDTSYANTAALYRLLGLEDDPLLASLLGFGLFVLVLFSVRGVLVRSAAAATVSALVFLELVLAAVYLGYYSKDSILSLLVLSVILFSRFPRWGALGVTMAIVVYGLLFRPYWLIVAALFVAAVVFNLPRWRRRHVILTMVLVSVAVGVVVSTALQMPSLDAVRIGINLGRVGSEDAGSAIQPFIRLGEPLSGVVNTALTLLALLVPLPLAILGGLYYLVLSAIIAFLWVAFFRAIGPGTSAIGESLYRNSAGVVVALLCVQALFEPDYGSALRHWTAVLPLVTLVCAARGGPINISESPLRRVPASPVNRRATRG